MRYSLIWQFFVIEIFYYFISIFYIHVIDKRENQMLNFESTGKSTGYGTSNNPWDAKKKGKNGSSTTSQPSALPSSLNGTRTTTKPDLQSSYINSKPGENLPTTKEEYTSSLSKLRDKNGKPLFDNYQIERLTKDITPENYSKITQLAQLDQLDGFHIKMILQFAQTSDANMAFINKLGKMQTADGKQKYNGEDLSRIALVLTQENSKKIEELLKIDGLSGANIGTIFRKTEEEKYAIGERNVDVALIRKISEMKTKDGKPRFSGNDIAHLSHSIKNDKDLKTLEKLTEIEQLDNYSIRKILEHHPDKDLDIDTDAIKKICEMKDEDGEQKYSEHEIISIAKAMKSNNKTAITKLLELQEKYGDSLFKIRDIDKFSEWVNNDNIALVEQAMKDAAKDGNCDINSIRKFIDSIPDDKLDMLNQLASITDKSGDSKFTAEELESLSKQLTKENFPFIKELAEMKTKEGDSIFNETNIWCLNALEDKPLQYIKQLASIETPNGKQRFSGDEITALRITTDENNLKFIKELAQIENLSGRDISSIVQNVNKGNIDFIKQLAGIKAKDGQLLFNAKDLAMFAKTSQSNSGMSTTERISTINELTKMQLSKTDIIKLSAVANKNNLLYIKQIAEENAKKGKQGFDSNDINNIIQYSIENDTYLNSLNNLWKLHH